VNAGSLRGNKTLAISGYETIKENVLDYYWHTCVNVLRKDIINLFYLVNRRVRYRGDDIKMVVSVSLKGKELAYYAACHESH